MALKISNDLDKHDLPEETDVVLRTTLERLDSKILKDKTGLRRQDAHKLLQSFLARNERGEKGGRVLRYRTEQEGALLETLTRYLVVRSAFDDQRLYTELLQSLREANLLLATEIPSFRRLKQIFALYAVSILHGSRVILATGSEAELLGGSDGTNIVVSATAEITHSGQPIKTATAIFQTTIKAADACEPFLAQSVERGGSWSMPIELHPSGRLVALT